MIENACGDFAIIFTDSFEVKERRVIYLTTSIIIHTQKHSQF